MRGLHDIFHINHLQRYKTNGLDSEAPPLEISGEEHYEVQAMWKHCVVCGEVQYLVKWVGYDELENLWLTASKMDSPKQILEAYRKQNRLNSAVSIT